MTEVTLPAAVAFGRTLSDLLGKEVKMVALPTAPSLPIATSLLGVYDDGAGALAACWLSDLAASAALAAALTLVPAGAVKDVLKANKLPPELADNIREIANISANSFGGKRVRLVEFGALGQAPSAPVSEWLKQAKQRADFGVEVPGYPKGLITLLA